jgi:hypothetical protein
MTNIELYALVSDAIANLDALKSQLDEIKELLDKSIDWKAMEGTDWQPER